MSIAFLFVFTFVFALGVFETAIFKTTYIGHPLSWIISDSLIQKERRNTTFLEDVILFLLRIIRYISSVSPILCLMYQVWFWFIHILKITQ
jgi:hypothetical protein